MGLPQAKLDQRNAAFWDELCGTTLAEQLGITGASADNLARFDEAYMGLYPYLEGYLPGEAARGKRLLEIGLGYGTVSQILAAAGADYHGLDIATGPVEMVRHRIHELGLNDPEERVQVGSVLEAPHPDDSFDQIVTIGCLHHTGDLAGAVGEVHRMLRPGGAVMLMIYNRTSYRRAKMAAAELPARLRGRSGDEEEMRGAYDRNAEGEAAPATEYTSKREAKELLGDFSKVNVRRENFDYTKYVPRERLLGWPAHLAGLDLYITAVK